MSRPLLAALAVLAVIVTAIVLWPNGDDGPDIADMSVEDLASLDVGAREFVSLAVRGASSDFHARYQGTGNQTIEVWALGGDVRQLVEAADGTATITQKQGDETTRCVDEGSGWACEPLAQDELDPDDLALRDAIEQLTADLVGTEVIAVDDEIAGLPVRCFAFTADGGSAGICLTEDGIVARLASVTESLELTMVDDDVEEGDFTLPG